MIKNKYIFLFYAIFSITYASAQYVAHPLKIEDDSIQCLEKISVYREFVKLKMFDKAISDWIKAYNSCRGFRKIIYQDARKLLIYSIEKEKDKNIKRQLVDSLMHIYEERIKYFGEEDYIRGVQGIDLYTYNRTKIDEARAFLFKSLELNGNKTDANVISYLMLMTDRLFKKEKIGFDEFELTYTKCSDALSYQIKNEQDANTSKSLKAIIDYIDAFFTKNAKNCESLANAFEKKIKEDGNNVEALLKMQASLTKLKCTDLPLYFEICLKIQKLQPSAFNSNLLAGLLLVKEDYQKSISYFKEAIELENNDSLKAIYLHDMAYVHCYKLKEFKKARELALNSIKLRPKWGKPYLLIGDAYAMSSPGFGGSEFKKATVFWASVDKYYKAKSIDPEIEKVANQKINYYHSFFPKDEDIFMQGLGEGSNYHVGGWINETTKIRARK